MFYLNFINKMSSRILDIIDSITTLHISNDEDEDKNLQPVSFESNDLPSETYITAYWNKKTVPDIKIRLRLLTPYFYLAHKLELSSTTLDELNESALSSYPLFKSLQWFLSEVTKHGFSKFHLVHHIRHCDHFIVKSADSSINVILCFFLIRSRSLIRTTFTLKVAIVSGFDRLATEDYSHRERCLNMTMTVKDLLTQGDFYPANETTWDFARHIVPLHESFIESQNTKQSSVYSNLKYRHITK